MIKTTVYFEAESLKSGRRVFSLGFETVEELEREIDNYNEDNAANNRAYRRSPWESLQCAIIKRETVTERDINGRLVKETITRTPLGIIYPAKKAPLY